MERCTQSSTKHPQLFTKQISKASHNQKSVAAATKPISPQMYRLLVAGQRSAAAITPALANQHYRPVQSVRKSVTVRWRQRCADASDHCFWPKGHHCTQADAQESQAVHDLAWSAKGTAQGHTLNNHNTTLQPLNECTRMAFQLI